MAKGNNTIETLEEWFLYAPPEKGERHWVDGRSAKEMARAWLGDESRGRLMTLLHPTFGNVVLESAEPECNVPFDEFSGPRQCDLVLQARSDQGKIVVHIEGKTDEAFGSLTGKAYDDAVAANATKKSNERQSKVPRRIELLSQRLFGVALDQTVRSLRYQLMFSTAAAVADAARRESAVAVMVVQQFHSQKLDGRKLRQNADDWSMFLCMFSEIDERRSRQLDTLIGPVSLARTQWKDVHLYFAKLVTALKSD